MPEGGLAFYNCGEHSGRSQPHKHLQVVPLPFADGQPAVPPVQVALELDWGAAAALEVVELRSLPFRAYAAKLPDRCVGGG
jgi:ATP adenylyltransferase